MTNDEYQVVLNDMDRLAQALGMNTSKFMTRSPKEVMEMMIAHAVALEAERAALVTALPHWIKWGENAVEAGCDDKATAAYAIQNHRILNEMRAALAAVRVDPAQEEKE